MTTIFNKRRKEAEYKLKLARNEIYQLNKYIVDMRKLPKYIKNLPKSPRRVEIEFHIGARKVVMFDGENFIKPDGQVYRLASIKCWRNI